MGTKVQISSCLIPSYILESVLICDGKRFLALVGMLLGHRYMYSYKFDSTLNVNHLLISFFIKHHCPVAFKILSLWFVLGLFVQYQRVDIYFDKKFQIKFSRGFAKRPKLTFDLVGFDLTKGFQASIFYP